MLKWETAKIFISSTFTDMHSERDHLIKVVFPRLREDLEKFHIHVIDIDLRWGVTEEQSHYAKEICLEQIEECPFFIAFLGERYGSIPEGEEISITELEIREGALSSKAKETKSKAFFYFRNNNFTKELIYNEQRQMYFDYTKDGEINTHIAEKLRKLKQEIIKDQKVRHYELQWDPNLITPENKGIFSDLELEKKMITGRLTNLEKLGEMVYQDLLTAILEKFPQQNREIDPLVEEADMQSIFVERRGRFHIGREQQKHQLTSFVQNPQKTRSLVLLGNSGSGKSSFLASWYEKYAQQSTKDFIFVHFVGASPQSAKPEQLMNRLCRTLQKTFSLPSAEEENKQKSIDWEDWQKKAENLLEQAAQTGTRIILIIDALNQLEKYEESHLLHWLPQRLPKNVYLIMSALPGECLDSLRIRSTNEWEIANITTEDTKSIIKRFLQDYNKQLSSEQQQLLIEKSQGKEPIYLRIALEELRLFGSFQNLTLHIQKLPEDITSLLIFVIKRLEEEQGEHVREILTYLACSRSGLSEQEILSLLEEKNNQPIPAFYWAKLYRSLRIFLVKRSGLFTFFHDHLHHAVIEKYNLHNNIEIHKNLALFFENVREERHIHEYPYQLQKSQQWHKLAQTISNIDFFVKITQNWDFKEVIRYWVSIKDKNISPVEMYKESLFAQETNTLDYADTCSRVAKVLDDMGFFKYTAEIYESVLGIELKELGEYHIHVATSYNNLGNVYNDRGDYDQAIIYYEKSLKVYLKQLGENHPYVAILYNNLGSVYNDKGNCEKAIVYYEKSLKIYLEQLGENHIDISTLYNNLGSVYDDKGDEDNAILYYRKSLKIRQAQLGENHPDIATSYNGIANVYNDKGEYDKAISYYQKSLKIYLEQLGENHPSVATSYNGIGNVQFSKECYNEAISYYQKSLDIKLKQLGENHPSVATSYSSIANVYNSKGLYDKAISYYQKSLDIRMHQLDQEHPSIATSYHGIGNVYNNKGEYDKAISYYQKSLDIKLKQLGENHPSIISLYNNFGSVYNYKGKYDKAISYYQKSLDIRSELDQEHPSIATSYHGIGNIYNNKGEYDKAISYYQKSLDIKLKQQHESLFIAISYNDLGNIYNNKGEYDKAISYYQKSLDIKLKQLDENHPDMAISYNGIAGVYNNQGEYDKAISYYQKSLDINLKQLGENHPNVAISYNGLANIHNDKEEYNQAIFYYEKSLNIKLKLLDKNHPSINISYNNIANVYNDKGEYDKAIVYYQKSLHIISQDHETNLEEAACYQGIGSVHSNKGEYDEAISYYQKSLDIRLEKLGENHPTIINLYNNFGSVYNYKGEYDKAISYYQKSLDIKLQQQDTNHPCIATSYNGLGNAYNNKKEYNKAISYYQKSLDIKLQPIEKNRFTAISYHGIGNVYNNKGEYDKAISYYEKSLDIKLQQQHEDHADIAISYNGLADAFNEKKEYDKAISYYQKSLEINLKQQLVESHPFIATSYNGLGNVYNNKGEYDKAISYYQKSLDIRVKKLGQHHPQTQETLKNIESVKAK